MKVRLSNSLHGSGFTVFVPGFDCDSCVVIFEFRRSPGPRTSLGTGQPLGFLGKENHDHDPGSAASSASVTGRRNGTVPQTLVA